MAATIEELELLRQGAESARRACESIGDAADRGFLSPTADEMAAARAAAEACEAAFADALCRARSDQPEVHDAFLAAHLNALAGSLQATPGDRDLASVRRICVAEGLEALAACLRGKAGSLRFNRLFLDDLAGRFGR